MTLTSQYQLCERDCHFIPVALLDGISLAVRCHEMGCACFIILWAGMVTYGNLVLWMCPSCLLRVWHNNSRVLLIFMNSIHWHTMFITDLFMLLISSYLNLLCILRIIIDQLSNKTSFEEKKTVDKVLDNFLYKL